jgi:hypothetical protein
METAYNANLPPVDDTSWTVNTYWGFDDPVYHRYAGPFSGGNTLTIAGENFGGYADLTAQDVKIGPTSCVSTAWVSATSLECVVPPLGTLELDVQVSHEVKITVGQYEMFATNPYVYDCPCAQDALGGKPGCFIPEYDANASVYKCSAADLCVNDGDMAGSDPWLPDPNCNQTWRTCLSDPTSPFSGRGNWSVCGVCDTATHPAAVDLGGECVCDTGYYRNTGVNLDLNFGGPDGCETSIYCETPGNTDESDCACEDLYGVGSVYNATNQFCWCDETRNFVYNSSYFYCVCDEGYFFNTGTNLNFTNGSESTCVASTHCVDQGSEDTDDCACEVICAGGTYAGDDVAGSCDCPIT